MTAAVVGNSRSEIDDLDRLRGPYTTSDRQKDRTKWRPIRLGLGGRGAGRNLRIVLDLGSNSVTGDAVFAGYGQEVGMPAAGTYWPRGGGPCNGGFFVFLLWLFSHLYHQTALHPSSQPSSSPRPLRYHAETNSKTQRPVRVGERQREQPHSPSPRPRSSVVLCEEAPEKDICAGSFHM